MSERSNSPSDVHAEALDKHLSESIDFQRRWKRRTAGVYYTTTILTIVSASIATLVGGLGFALGAAIAAAVAAIASGLEKGLVFRDKWGHHRNVETELTMIQLQRQVGRLDVDHALAELEGIERRYATRLPVESSGGGTG